MFKYNNGKLSHVSHGQLAMKHLGLKLELNILESAAGWYIGTFNNEGPISRESVEYYQSESLAISALDNNLWTQRDHV